MNVYAEFLITRLDLISLPPGQNYWCKVTFGPIPLQNDYYTGSQTDYFVEQLPIISLSSLQELLLIEVDYLRKVFVGVVQYNIYNILFEQKKVIFGY